VGLIDQSTGARDAPSQPKPQARWIYSSKLDSGPIRPSSPEDADPITTPSPATTTPAEIAEIPSPPQNRRMRWLFDRLPFALFNRSPEGGPSTRIPRGAKSAVTSVSPGYQSAPFELAITTEIGLNMYIDNADKCPARTHRAMSIPPTDDDSGPLASNERGTRYENIKLDVFTVVNHLRDMKFSEMRPQCLSAESSIESQVATYLSRPPDNPAATQVRMIILTGHNVNETKLVINQNVTYRWSRLREALKTIPSGVVVVIVLACCRAGGILEELAEVIETHLPSVVVIASSDRSELSSADDQDGDYFLDALFKVLQGESFQEGSTEWKGFLRLIMIELKKKSTTQHPVIYVATELVSQNLDDMIDHQ
jgi:hypothetical protein